MCINDVCLLNMSSGEKLRPDVLRNLDEDLLYGFDLSITEETLFNFADIVDVILLLLLLLLLIGFFGRIAGVLAPAVVPSSCKASFSSLALTKGNSNISSASYLSFGFLDSIALTRFRISSV